MKLGILSDSHDHLPNLRYALAQLNASGAEALLHCGDLIAPFVSQELGAFNGPVHTVFGNNDADRFLALKLAPENVTHHGEFAHLEFAGLRIGMSHYGEYARGLVASSQADVAFFGHTHEFCERREPGGLVANPGELLGMKGNPSFCVFDTKTQQLERIVFSHQLW